MKSDYGHTATAAVDVAAAIGDVAMDESLVARARDLAPIIREHAETTEHERRLARPVLQAMREAGLFRMFTPRALGGLETDPVTVARVAEEVARVLTPRPRGRFRRATPARGGRGIFPSKASPSCT